MRLFLDGAIKIVHTAPWPHYPNKKVFNDRWNRLHGKSASLRCGGRPKLFHSSGPAAAKALSPKVLWVQVTTHVQLSAERTRRSRASATRRQSSAVRRTISGQWPMNKCGNLEIDAYTHTSANANEHTIESNYWLGVRTIGQQDMLDCGLQRRPLT